MLKFDPDNNQAIELKKKMEIIKNGLLKLVKEINDERQYKFDEFNWDFY